MLNGDVVVKPQGLGRALEGGTTASAGADKQQCCKAQYRLAQLVRRCCFAQGVTNGFVRAAALFLFCPGEINYPNHPHFPTATALINFLCFPVSPDALPHELPAIS